jgi:Flp pilus assembly protein TadB
VNLALTLLAGAALGASLWLLLVAVVPARPSLAASLALLRGNPAPAASPAAGRHPGQRRRAWQVQVGRAVEQTGQALGLQFRSLRKDLAVTGQPLEAHLATKVLYAIGGGLVGPVVAGLLVLSGVPVPLALPVWLALGLAVVGWLVPDRRLRAAAAARRASLRYATGALLNLVAINLAGGAEVEQSLHNALRISHGWAFVLLRNTVRRAQLNREKVWDALGRLGAAFDVDELIQLAQNVSLAGDEGARMRESLIAMAASIGQRELAEAETQANEASEHMVLPLAVLAIAFTAFLLYPALVQLTVGF